MIPLGEPLDENGPEREIPAPARQACKGYCTPRRSTTKMRVSFGLIAPAAPREP